MVSPASSPVIVYPPCDTELLRAMPLERPRRRGGRAAPVLFVSVAQFRPEKDHMMQVRAFARATEIAAAASTSPGGAPRRGRRADHPMLSAELQIIGSCRNAVDERRLLALREEVARLGLGARVSFRVSLPFPELMAALGDADAGLHTMVDEHFGISVVEYMAAGAVPIAHDSAGPSEDIVGPANAGGGGGAGLLASSLDGFAEAMVAVAGLDPARRLAMAGRAREYVAERFSNDAFAAGFAAAFSSRIR